MDKQFLKTHFNQLCATNIELIRGEIRGIALYFTGLGHKHYLGNDMAAAPICAENGILYILPYYNTWCWMNNKTVRYIDTIIDTAMELYNVDKNVPIGLYGGSMGGYNTFHYAIKSKYKIVAADVLCPCCNMEYELYCNANSLFRSYFEAVMEDTEDFAAYVRDNSPVNMADKLPKIPYRFAVGLKDMTLVVSQHSDLMIERMQAAGHDVSRCDYPEVAHCNLPHLDRIAEHKWLCERMLEAANG